MVDIWGRSKKKATSDDKTTDEVKKIIKDEIANNFNLVSVDPNEIVVFGDKTGKLKTSNVSLDSLLTRPEGVDDDSIAVFKAGKLEPSYNINRFSDKFDTIDNINVNTNNAVKNLAILQSAYDSHVANFAQLRRNFNTADNAIEKFFGKKNIKPDEVTTTLPDLKKSIEDIKTITDPNSITTIKQDIARINSWIGSVDISKPLSLILDKVKKIPHDNNDVKNLTYVVYQQLDIEYINPNEPTIQLHKTTVVGIYRFTVLSEHKFNIEIWVNINTGLKKGSSERVNTGVNTVLLYVSDVKNNYFAIVIPSNVVRTKFGCILEYVSAIDNV